MFKTALFASLVFGHALAIAGDDKDLVFNDLCSKEIVLLGEASHGDGETILTKAELVEKLIQKCGFKALLFESGVYDFLNIERKVASSQEVSQGELGAAIKPFWSSTKEFLPLLKVLHEKVNKKLLWIGGVDDQIDHNSIYAQKEMAKDLTQYLPLNERKKCLGKLRDYIGYKFSEQDKTIIDKCISKIALQLQNPTSPNGQKSRFKIMADSLSRLIQRDFSMPANESAFNKRDMSMFYNFLSLVDGKKHEKIILWGASVHISKVVLSDRINRIPLGYYLSKKYGERMYALAFSAFSGSYAILNQSPKDIPVAPKTSLEGQISPGRLFQYFNKASLHSLGELTARPYNYDWSTRDWANIFDGFFVFEKERPPILLNP